MCLGNILGSWFSSPLSTLCWWNWTSGVCGSWGGWQRERATCGTQIAGPRQQDNFCACSAHWELQDCSPGRGLCTPWSQCPDVSIFLHVEVTWLETQWGTKGWAVMHMFTFNLLIFFGIWGALSLAGTRQDFLVPSERCVCTAYVRGWWTVPSPSPEPCEWSQPPPEQACVWSHSSEIRAGFAQWQSRAGLQQLGARKGSVSHRAVSYSGCCG